MGRWSLIPAISAPGRRLIGDYVASRLDVWCFLRRRGAGQFLSDISTSVYRRTRPAVRRAVSDQAWPGGHVAQCTTADCRAAGNDSDATIGPNELNWLAAELLGAPQMPGLNVCLSSLDLATVARFVGCVCAGIAASSTHRKTWYDDRARRKTWCVRKGGTRLRGTFVCKDYG